METLNRVQLELFSSSVPAAAQLRRLSQRRQRVAPRPVAQPNVKPAPQSMVAAIPCSPLIAYQGHPPFVVTSETSRDAADSIADSSGVIRAKVFECIRAQGSWGATCDEVEVALDLRHQTASARCRELVLQGRLEKRVDPSTGKSHRRPTRSGRKADVLFAV